ncbi:hypothetical protein R3P38DRAFT_3472009 [Favolaschia claudopus]|uniref:DUF6535 domain-containing protein n=1 Tax=Favolaschia claudopus TaxID=2862362 RepID=A0AAV9ZCZ2_9AGAR
MSSTIGNIASPPLNENERDPPPESPPSHTNTAAQPITDNERLIQELKAGFASLVHEQQEMRKAITDSKPKPPTATDKKTTFWNGYMILANEYDKEFLQKYGTDLDTSLIFAGLFSAVASAFIIQIQPEFESTPHPLTVVAQSLLYISLGSTLLAALLAVLGKQWLMYYSAAGERGTIEARGLERQRKLDGLQKWKFELIMQAFPLLLQFGLFLFAAALSVYLWRIHHILAGIVLGITAAGTITYLALLVSAIFFDDSPFQTPLAPFLRTMLSFILALTSSLLALASSLLALASSMIPKYIKVKVKETFQDHSFVKTVKHYIKQTYSSIVSKSKDILPTFALKQTTGPVEPTTLFDTLSIIPSPEVPAVHWILETSTDPIRLAEAADISIDLQWPLDMDLPLDVHVTQFLGCFEYHLIYSLQDKYVLERLRDGMHHRATRFGCAYLAMRTQDAISLSGSPLIMVSINLDEISPELATILSIIDGTESLRLTTITSQPSLLRTLCFTSDSRLSHYNSITYLKYVVTKLDSNSPLTSSTFSDYLFVVYSCLVKGHISAHDVRVADKSAYEVLLYGKILKTLPSKIKSQTIDMQLTTDVLKLTLQLARNCRDHREWNEQWRERRSLAYNFCQALPQTDNWIQVICIPGLFPSKEIWWRTPSSNPAAESWIYPALRSIPSPINEQGKHEENIVETLNGLLCALYNNAIPLYKDSLELLVQLLSFPGDVSNTAAWLLLQENVYDWYIDPEFGPKLQDHSVWALLSAAVLNLKHWQMLEQYVDLAYLLSAIPEWQPYLEKEKCCWIRIFPVTYIETSKQDLRKYNAVFKTIWAPSSSTSTQTHLKEAIGLVYGALSEFWALFDFAVSLDTKSLFAWMECSNSVIFHWDLDLEVCSIVRDTQMMQELFIPLHNNLLGFVNHIQSLPSEKRTPMVAACGEIVRDLATKMLQTEINDMYDVRQQIYGKIEEARKLVAET